LVKKLFSDENGNFDENSFNNAYYTAYQKYVELTDDEQFENLAQELEYSPSDRFKPLNGKVKDVSVEYKHLKNPMQQAYGIEGINKISESTKTKEEVAQSNQIFDPETGKFTNETPESLSLIDKAVGRTLIYAKYNEDGYHIDPLTG
jgi:F0F1-type ATP synthase gamma subunit